MKLYERPSWLLEDYNQGIVPIDAKPPLVLAVDTTAAVRWYLEKDTRENWNLSDFPALIPPTATDGVLWLEYRMPHFIRSSDKPLDYKRAPRAGCVVSTIMIAPGSWREVITQGENRYFDWIMGLIERVRAAKGSVGKITITHADEARQIQQILSAEGVDCGAVLHLCPHLEVKDQGLVPLGLFMVYLDPRGAPIPGACQALIPLDHIPAANRAMAMESAWATAYPHLFAICLLNCENAGCGSVSVRIDPPPSPGLKRVRYITLEAPPDNERLADAPGVYFHRGRFIRQGPERSMQ